MRKVSLFILLVFLVLPLSAYGKTKNNIHPSFLRLLKAEPRNEGIFHPEIPRVSAREAFYLFSSGKAILFGVGVGMNQQHTVLSTHKLPQGKEATPGLLSKLKKIRNKYFLVF